MLADVIVARAQSGLRHDRFVSIETETTREAQIVEIEHVGGGLIRYRYAGGLPNDWFVPEARVKLLSIRPPESEW